MEDTIAAISTALGIGAISIIRVSGTEAISNVNKIFKGKDLSQVPTHTIHYGHIIDGDKIVDEVLVSVMKGPKSFTTEDIVEINCHGGIATTKKVLELLLLNGCRLAEPGEFTKRAFLNGRIDLLEAEGVMDVLNAKTEKSRNLAINQLSGKTSKLIEDLRQEIVNVLANIEVNIDYPEYEDIEQLGYSELEPRINNIYNEICKILKDSENGKIIKEGIDVSIIGRPNVGKSSILNRLLEEDKAIVTDIEGTTRDIVEGTINLGGLIVNFIDTAGIRKTDDVVEIIGVKKSLDLINKSDLVLYVLNNNEELSNDDKEILKELKSKNHIIVINKMDLSKKLDLQDESNIVYISALEDKNIDKLKEKIKEIYNVDNIETDDLTYLTNARSIALLKEAKNAIEESKQGIQNLVPIDVIEIDIKRAWNLLGEIIGKTYQEELINQLFSQFCLGK